MRRLAFTAFSAACAFAIGIPATIGLSAVGAEDQPHRPLSKIPRVERFGQEALDNQAEFLRRMSGVEVRYGENGAVSWMKGRTGIVLPAGLAGFKVGQSSRELLENIGPALLAAGTEELRVASVATHAGKADAAERASSPERAVNLVQYIRGREVQNSAVNVVLNQQTNEITLVVADFLPDRGLPHEAKLTAAQARAKVEAAMRDSVLDERRKVTFQDHPATLAYAFEEIGDNGGIGGALVWVFQALQDGMPVEVNVNALTGEVLQVRSFVTAALNRDSYTASYSFLVPPAGVTHLFGEAGPSPAQQIQYPLAAAAHSRANLTHTAFLQVFARDSYDGAGGTIKLVTNYGSQIGNAYYSPGGWLMFADGSASKKSGAEDLDVVTHEFTHGIFQNRVGIINNNGPVDGAPALNEGFADWGTTVPDVFINGVPSVSTWQMGSQNPNNPLDGVRNMWIPKSEDFWAVDWFPSRTQLLSGHSKYRNSSILGHAFYLLTNGGQHNRAGLPLSEVPVIPVTGLGYAAARDVFYYSLFTTILTPNSTYSSLKNATEAAALPAQLASVQQAWQAVGLNHNCSAAPQAPVITTWPAYCKGRYDITWPGVAGATRYDGQVTQANLGWAFAHTAVDGDVTSCQQDLPNAYWMMRVRACNGCGCSGWSNIEYMQYYMPCL